jgi:mono/diheme cytochrome c family protein
MKRVFTLSLGVSLLGTIVCVVSARADKKPLLPQAPAKYTQMTNPAANDPEAYQVGERIYTMKCAKCHELDDEGERRGPDLSTAEVKNAAPGALYWVLEKGNGDMPSFAKYPDKYRWQLVTYLQQRK